MRKWIMRRGEEFLELTYDIMDSQFRLYASFGRISKGERQHFTMERQELIEFRDKLNDALELTK